MTSRTSGTLFSNDIGKSIFLVYGTCILTEGKKPKHRLYKKKTRNNKILKGPKTNEPLFEFCVNMRFNMK